MKRNLYYKKRKWRGIVLPGILVFFLGLVSCNDDFDNKLSFEQQDDGQVGATSNKILYVVVDGAAGAVVGNQAYDYGDFPVMASLTQHGLFSWNSISDENNELATTYADMLTGVKKEKHKILDESLSNNDLKGYPLFFSRLKQYKNVRIAAFTASGFLNNTLIKAEEVDLKPELASDAEVKAAVLEELKNKDASVVFATFSKVDQSGQTLGYGPEVPEYMEAMKTADTDIGEILEALEARENYANENWLVVIASNKGGQYALDPHLDDGSVYSDTRRNNFVLFYNPKFSYKLVDKFDVSNPRYIGAAVKYTGSNAAATIPAAEADIYNFGNSATAGDYTVQMRIKVHTMGTLNGSFFSKQDNTGNNPAGWAFIYNGNSGWRFQANSTNIVDGTPLKLEAWTTLTVKLYNDGGTRTAKIFRNGQLITTNTNFNGKNLSSDLPLSLGYGNTSYGSGYEQSVVDVRIYNAALPDDYIEANFCSTIVNTSDPYYPNLIGYWPAIEGSGNEYEDKSPSKRNFSLTGTYVWNSFSERAGPTLCPTIPDEEVLETTVIRSVDIPLMIYNWMGLTETSKFNLDARNWSPTYPGMN